MRTETYIIDQGGIGTTEIVPAAAASGGYIAILNYCIVMSGAGTFAWSDGTDWLSGDIPCAQFGGVASAAGPRAAAGPHEAPLMVTKGKGRPISITTTGGSAHGHVTVELGR